MVSLRIILNICHLALFNQIASVNTANMLATRTRGLVLIHNVHVHTLCYFFSSLLMKLRQHKHKTIQLENTYI